MVVSKPSIALARSWNAASPFSRFSWIFKAKSVSCPIWENDKFWASVRVKNHKIFTLWRSFSCEGCYCCVTVLKLCGCCFHCVINKEYKSVIIYNNTCSIFRNVKKSRTKWKKAQYFSYHIKTQSRTNKTLKIYIQKSKKELTK